MLIFFFNESKSSPSFQDAIRNSDKSEPSVRRPSIVNQRLVFFFKFTSNAKARGIPAGPRGLEREREMGQWVAMCDTVQRLALAGACVLEMKEETTDQ